MRGRGRKHYGAEAEPQYQQSDHLTPWGGSFELAKSLLTKLGREDWAFIPFSLPSFGYWMKVTPERRPSSWESQLSSAEAIPKGSCQLRAVR